MLSKRSNSRILTQGKRKINFPKIVFFSSINLQTVVEMATGASSVTRSSASLVSCVWLVQTKGKEPGAREVRNHLQEYLAQLWFLWKQYDQHQYFACLWCHWPLSPQYCSRQLVAQKGSAFRPGGDGIITNQNKLHKGNPGKSWRELPPKNVWTLSHYRREPGKLGFDVVQLGLAAFNGHLGQED